VKDLEAYQRLAVERPTMQSHLLQIEEARRERSGHMVILSKEYPVLLSEGGLLVLPNSSPRHLCSCPRQKKTFMTKAGITRQYEKGT